MPRVSIEDGVLVRDGERRFVIAVDYQYYRERREDWAPRLKQLRDGGANTITCYIPWRHHWIPDGEDGAHRFDFEGATRPNRDLLAFIAAVATEDLDLIVKPGPFVHSELNIGGLPDRVSPSVVDDIEAARKHDGAALVWEYDDSILPAPLDPLFESLARSWLENVGAVLKAFWPPAGPIIAVQLNDETLYCTSNAAPWDFGYEASSLAAYRDFLAERYGPIEDYNRLHADQLASYAVVEAPRPDLLPKAREDWLALIDWGEWQWRLRRDAYARYKDYLALPEGCPALTNFAGITPPIEENVPEATPIPRVVSALDELYAEWWLATNRIDADRDIYHYGMISWLGVAAYGIPDPRTTTLSDRAEINRVFGRYINTAGRRRGINMEENWGFSKLYHSFSGEPIVPFFQTLASVAGGCTGYVIFCGVQHSHWDADLDRKTKKQWPTFPASAPLTSRGEKTPMYEAMALLNAWFKDEGEDFLEATRPEDLTWLIYPPYAAVSGWIPEGAPGPRPPRCGSVEGLETAADLALGRSFHLGMLELDAGSEDELARRRLGVLRLGSFMDEASQRVLIRYLEGGGQILAYGEWPERDLARGRPCTLLKDAAGSLPGLSFFPGDGFLRGALLQELETRAKARIQASDSLAAFYYSSADRGFLFFFDFGREPGRSGHIQTPEGPVDLVLGCKTCGVLGFKNGRLWSVLIKGENEVEDIVAEVSVSFGGVEFRCRGDGLVVLGEPG